MNQRCRIITNISNHSIEHLTDESLLETMFLHFVHKVGLCTQVFFAIVINQCKRSVIWTPYNYNNNKVLFFFLSIFLPFRFKEVDKDLNSTLISCYWLASITVQITFSFKRKDPTRQLWTLCSCGIMAVHVVPAESQPLYSTTTHFKRAACRFQTHQEVVIGCDTSTFGKAVFVNW